MSDIVYMRTSTTDQTYARQEQILKSVLSQPDVIIYKEQISGKDIERPQLQALLNYGVRAGDTVWCADVSRLARNTKDLMGIAETIQKKGGTLKFVSENLTFSDDAMGKFLLTVLAAIAELERNTIRERQRIGIDKAKERGVYKKSCGHPKKLPDIEKYYELWRTRQTTEAEVAKNCKVSWSTIHRRFKEFEAKRNESSDDRNL